MDGSDTPNQTRPIQPWHRDWQTAELRIRPLPIAARLWERVLTVPDRDRLGGDLEKAYLECRGTAGMWVRLRSVSSRRAVVEVAVALNLLDSPTGQYLLRKLGEESDNSIGNLHSVVAAGPIISTESAVAADPIANMDSAIAAGMLVLTDQPRQAYWSGCPIEIDWNNHSAIWSYFWQLCQHAKAGRPIDSVLFVKDNRTKYVAKQKSRLTSLDGFPQDLAEIIVSAGPGSQTLNLAASKIRIFDSSGGNLREWKP